MQSHRKSQTTALEDDTSTTNEFDTAKEDLPFEAIQISQIMILQCEILKDQIAQGNKIEAAEIVDAISERAIRIGKMMKALREKTP
ncbi:MAG: hypothetical protein PXY39_15030 [archaeon]|nr:hypothetical protein [archaeon]